MGYRIDRIGCIGPDEVARLGRLGIRRADQLLACGRTRAMRRDLSDEVIVEESVILKWVNLCDLMRVKGVGVEFAELLEAAGVDTVKELRNRNARNLAAAMRDANGVRRIVRVHPGENLIARWIAQAKELPPAVEH